MSIDDILADFEDLERDDILAALAYAARLSQVKNMECVYVATKQRNQLYCGELRTSISLHAVLNE